MLNGCGMWTWYCRWTLRFIGALRLLIFLPELLVTLQSLLDVGKTEFSVNL